MKPLPQSDGYRQPPPNKTAPKLFPTPRQPTSNRSDRPAELLRRLIVGEALQVAEHYRNPILLREPFELLVEHQDQIIAMSVVCGGHRTLGSSELMPAAPGLGHPGAIRDPIGRPVQPTGQRVAVANRAGLADQDQEGRLEGIMGIVRLVQNQLTDAKHHGAVSLDNGCERQLGGLPGAAREPLHQLGISKPSECPDFEQCMEVLEVSAISSLCHLPDPRSTSDVLK